MILAGAGGFAKEVFEIIKENNQTQGLQVYVDKEYKSDQQFYSYPIINDTNVLKNHFRNDNSFVIGIGNPKSRLDFTQRLINLGGQPFSLISPNAELGSQNVSIGEGTVILGGARVSNSVTINQGSIVYYNAVIAHDCKIGDFVEISPSATILGNVTIGDLTQIGANATILPNVTIGKNVIVGAGTVVTKNIEDNSIVVGNPAVFLRANEE
jgi:sugar O-acyltransferase (sialic acid O-acetyltransferase NeuD family)